jgi:hypothetical protein
VFGNLKKEMSIKMKNSILVILTLLTPLGAPGMGVAQNPAHTYSGQSTIVVWKVGSPHEGETPKKTLPPALLARAAAIGSNLTLTTFPAQGFAPIFFDSVASHTEPDILVINNYGIIDGSVTRLGTFAGIGSDPAVRKSLIDVAESFDSLQDGRGGWEFLLSTSRNFSKARKLALAGLECNPEVARYPAEIDADALEEVKAFSLSAIRAYFKRDQTRLDQLSAGGKYPNDSFHLPDRTSKIHARTICGLWGNELIAFVNSVVVYENDVNLGKKNMLIVAQRSPSNGWELKVISEHPLVISALYNRVPGLSHGRSDDSITAPELISPPDQARFDKRFPLSERPDIEWTSAASNVIVYLVESQFRHSSWSSGSFSVYPRIQDAKTFKVKATFGVGAQPHRWRVWAITKSGDARISSWRTIIYTH